MVHQSGKWILQPGFLSFVPDPCPNISALPCPPATPTTYSMSSTHTTHRFCSHRFWMTELLCTSASALSTLRWAAKDYEDDGGGLSSHLAQVNLLALIQQALWGVFEPQRLHPRSWLGLWAVNRRWLVRASDTFELQRGYLRRMERNITWWEQKEDAITSWLSRAIETKNEDTLNSHEGRRNIQDFLPCMTLYFIRYSWPPCAVRPVFCSLLFLSILPVYLWFLTCLSMRQSRHFIHFLSWTVQWNRHVVYKSCLDSWGIKTCSQASSCQHWCVLSDYDPDVDDPAAQQPLHPPFPPVEDPSDPFVAARITAEASWGSCGGSRVSHTPSVAGAHNEAVRSTLFYFSSISGQETIWQALRRRCALMRSRVHAGPRRAHIGAPVCLRRGYNGSEKPSQSTIGIHHHRVPIHWRQQSLSLGSPLQNTACQMSLTALGESLLETTRWSTTSTSVTSKGWDRSDLNLWEKGLCCADGKFLLEDRSLRGNREWSIGCFQWTEVIFGFATNEWRMRSSVATSMRLFGIPLTRSWWRRLPEVEVSVRHRLSTLRLWSILSTGGIKSLGVWDLADTVSSFQPSKEGGWTKGTGVKRKASHGEICGGARGERGINGDGAGAAVEQVHIATTGAGRRGAFKLTLWGRNELFWT